MFRAGAVVVTILVLLGADAMAQAPVPNPFPDPFQGTPEEQAACRPDSSKYCREFEPDNLRVLTCLQRNRTKISKACLRVLESHGQ